MRASRSREALFNQSTVTIESLRESDIKEFIAVSRQTRKETYPTYTEEKLDVMYGEEYLNIITKELADKAYVYLVMKEQNKIFGFAKLDFHDQQKPVLDKLYLIKQFQRRGHGTLLLRKCYDITLERDHNQLWLGVYRKNTGAIAFYQNNGFRQLPGTTSFVNPTTGEVNQGSDIPMQCDDIKSLMSRYVFK